MAKAQFNHQINGYNANLGAAGNFPDPIRTGSIVMWVGQYIGRATSDAGDVAMPAARLSWRDGMNWCWAAACPTAAGESSWWKDSGDDLNVTDYYHWTGNVPAPPGARRPASPTTKPRAGTAACTPPRARPGQRLGS